MSISANNLPLPPAALVGRAVELAALRLRLLEDDVRLLTLTGPAGTGKTRLAIASATQLVDAFEDGVWFVDLAPISDVGGVLPAIAQVLGLRGAASELSPGDSARLYLGDKHVLLVVDNCEHLLGAAPGLAALLDACPRLAILATSREPLRVRRERLHPISPLATPSPRAVVDVPALLEVASIELFVQRARDVQPDFRLSPENATAVAELCVGLDGLPLALELAAARSRVLPPQAMLARLESRFDLLRSSRRDDPERHQTLRAALDWSHDLLSADEQTLFRRLAAFAGGCTLEGAEAVCDPRHELSGQVLDSLEALLDKSLLKQEETAGEPRFSMLETVRAYALEALEASGEAEGVRRRHAAHYTRLVGAAAVELRGPRQMAWLDRLDREQTNIRASLQFLAALAAAGDSEASQQGLQLGGDLWWYMHVRGTYAETRELLRPLLVVATGQPASVAQGRAVATVSVASWNRP